jgi:hypothetical protein
LITHSLSAAENIPLLDPLLFATPIISLYYFNFKSFCSYASLDRVAFLFFVDVPNPPKKPPPAPLAAG